MKIGFIGLGNLGKPIALNLKMAGLDLFVFNRTPSKMEPLVTAGAIPCNNIGELARHCKVVFSIVSDDAALKTICTGENGLIAHLADSAIHISMSTILPATAGELAGLHGQNNQHYFSAPVFGRPEAAAAKKLNFVVSGNSQIKSQIEPLLKDAGGAGIFDFGSQIAAANTVKLCGNFLIAAALEAIGESIHLARKSGVDATSMWNMFLQTIFNTPLYHNYSNIILKQQFEPAAFTAKLGLKDLNLVLTQAKTINEHMPMAELLKLQLQRLQTMGKEQIDWSAISEAETETN